MDGNDLAENRCHEQRADLQHGGKHGNPACGGRKLHHAGERRQGCHFCGYPSEKLYDVEAAGRFFQIAGMSSLSEVYFKGIGDVPVTFVLDKKTGAPISYEIDLAQALEKVTNNVLSELSSDNESSGITVQTYRISSELTQLGNVKAGEIPDEVKSSAINYEREISMLESDE